MLDFEAIFNALATAAVVVDASRIVAMNPTAQTLLGEAIVVGTALIDVPRLQRADVVVIELGAGRRLLQLPSSSPSTFSASSHEELWQSYTELRVKYRRLVSQLDQAPVLMAILRGKDHVFDMVNPLYEQYARRPLLGLASMEAFPEAAAQGVKERLDTVYRTGEPMVLRSRTVLDRKPGDPPSAAFDVLYHPLKEQGEVVGIFVLATDVTDRQLMQERAALLEEQTALLEAERQFLIESIPQQAWIAQADTGSFDFVNARVVAYFGEPSATMLGHGWQAFVHPADLQMTVDRWTHSLRSGEDFDVNFRLRRHDGAWRWHIARATAMRDDDGIIVKWFGTSTDMDDQARNTEELLSRVAFEQMLIGIVSHDLRNPLNAISLSAAVVEGDNLQDKQREALKRVTSSTARATRLINDLLDFTQARSSGSIPVHPSAVVLADIIDEVVDERRAVHTDCCINVVHEHDAVTIAADHDRLAQLLDNLIGNAIQHSPKNCIVHIRSSSDDNAVVIAIENDGTIAATDLSRLFQPFQQGEKSTRAHSVGLGLYIATKIAEAHGGTIDVSSTTTTRFTVILPRARA